MARIAGVNIPTNKRVVIADSGLPASFKDTYQPRMGYDISKD